MRKGKLFLRRRKGETIEEPPLQRVLNGFAQLAERPSENDAIISTTNGGRASAILSRACASLESSLFSIAGQDYTTSETDRQLLIRQLLIRQLLIRQSPVNRFAGDI
jgi:hypothetical protein